VQGSFHGRLVVARLASEGVPAQLRGVSDGPYPLQGAVEVFVGEENLALAREILLADAVDAAVDDDSIIESTHPGPPSESDLVGEPAELRHRYSPRHLAAAGTALAILLVLTLVVVGAVVYGG
jgi:hypothetical protein